MGRERSSWRIDPGQHLAPGRVVRAVLGGGARYEVYLTFNERIERLTVLKVLRPALLGDGRERRAMAREAQVLAAVEHRGLLSAITSNLGEERPFLEMEYVEGRRLSTSIRRNGAMGVAQVVSLGRDLAAALDHFRATGYVHLDVKPSNVILTPSPRLIDFSVARRIDRAHRVNGFVGTDAYMAPEQADPSRWSTVGPKCDSWGLGVTLYRALSGHLPYPRGRRDGPGAERFPQLADAPAPLHRRLPPPLTDLIMAALRRSPGTRPSVAELHEGFGELAARIGVGNVRGWSDSEAAE